MKKIISILSLSILIIFFISCGGKKDAGDGNVTIKFWNFPNFTVNENFDNELIAAFEAKNPNIKVEFTKISFNDGPAQINSAIVSKTAPDVIYDAPGRIMDWAAQGVLADLNSILPKDISDKIPSKMLTPVTVNGKIYMYPINTAPFLMGFNKTMLEKVGIANLLPLNKPMRSWTVAEYEALLTAIKQKVAGVQPAMFYAKSQAGDQGTRAFIANLYGSEIINPALTKYMINNEAGVKALSWVVDAIKKGILGPGGESLVASDVIDMYVQGTAASSILYSPGLQLQNQPRAKDNFETVFIPYPNDARTPKLEYLIGGPCVFDNGDAAKVEAAKKFIAFMAQDVEWAKRVVLATGSFAARSDLKGLYNTEEYKYLESLLVDEYLETYYNTAKGFVEMRTYWFAALQQAMTGQATPKAALDTFVQRSDATLK